MKHRWINYLLTAALTAAVTITSAMATTTTFQDVPQNDSLAVEVEKAAQYDLMRGYGNGVFGFRDSITRAQFVTVLGRMMNWDMGEHLPMPEAMEVPQGHGYYGAIAAAAANSVAETDQPFRPSDPITRGEMAEMLVRSLGLRGAAEQLKEEPLPFTDVSTRQGYIAVAYDIGMTKGTSATTFSPDRTATRAQAAAMLVRIYEKITQDTWSHAHYALSSYSQLSLATQADAVTLGWSRMNWDGSSALLATTSLSSYEYYIPSGYEEVVETLEDSGVKLHLGVYMDQGNGIGEMLASPEGRQEAVEQIVNELTVSYRALGRNPYSGVTIDFEGLREAQRKDFTAFMTELREALGEKTLYVCVSPVLHTGPYYDGYDYRSLGEVADKIILMAYDYDPLRMEEFMGTTYYKTAAPAPIDQVYLALKAITDETTGVADAQKVILGVSFKNVAWSIIGADETLSASAPYYPSKDIVAQRLAQEGTRLGWSETYAMPYAVYESSVGKYFLWYEDARSVEAKRRTASLFGVNSISYWRLGTIPDGIPMN